MKRIDHPTAPSNQFTEGNPSTGQAATTVTPDFMNDLQEEICAVIEDSDGGNTTLNGNSQTQLKEAIIAIAVANVGGGGGGGGGDSAGGITKFTEATNGSDASTTSTSNATAFSVTHTAVAAGNDRLVDLMLDWDVSDTDGNRAKAYAVLQSSPDNSAWTDLVTFTKDFNTLNGEMIVKRSEQILGSDHISNSNSNVATGLQLDYTAVKGANPRLVQLHASHKAVDSNGGGAAAYSVLQYWDGGNWIDLKELKNQGAAGGANNVGSTQTQYWEVMHTANDSTPQYRVVHRSDSGDSSEFYAGSKLIVKELESVQISNNRAPIFHTYRDTTSKATAYYRIQHRVESGDSSTIHSGSILRVKEIAN